MTGEKNRFTTTEKLWKLNDETLSTPKHDEMVLYLLNKENVIKTVPEVKEFFSNNVQLTRYINRYKYLRIPDFWEKIKSCTNIENLLKQYYVDKTERTKTPRHQFEKWGYDDIVSPKNYKLLSFDEVGYNKAEIYHQELYESELNIKVKKHSIRWSQLIESYHKQQMEAPVRDIKIQSEVPILGYNKFILGYWDLKIYFDIQIKRDDYFQTWLGKENEDTSYIEYKSLVDSLNKGYGKWENLNKSFLPVFIEVKPIIKSFGETLRQLKTYQSYVHESVGRTYLFTTTTEFKDAFENQGIRVIEYTQ